MLRLKEKYQKEVIPVMMEKFGYKNKLAVPKISKVVINTGFGRLISGQRQEQIEKTLSAISRDLALITGQKPIFTKARKSIAAFKIRKGQYIGAKVTLRRKRMFDFLEKLIRLTLPRSRDFRGLKPESLDRNGNLTIPIREQIVFPEISPEKIDFIFGLEITIVTTAKTAKEALMLFQLLGFPIKNLEPYGNVQN